MLIDTSLNFVQKKMNYSDCFSTDCMIIFI